MNNSSNTGSFRKIQVHKLSSDFRDATHIITCNFRDIQDNEVLLQNIWVGINASDINYTAGHYRPGLSPPFDAGFEAISIIKEKGKNVKHFKENQIVVSTSFSAFSEYQYIKANRCIPVPELSPRMLPLMVSGLTASLSLEYVGNMKSNQNVLITAAGGATGSFAVQLAKLQGNHVIGTCSSDEKGLFLKQLGCDRVINYRKESLDNVLKQEYPKGIDLVYECVGGEMYETCVKNLAIKGRIIVIGMISGYQDQSTWSVKDPSKLKGKPVIEAELLKKSASISGFFMNHFLQYAPEHMQKLSELVMTGKIQSAVDSTSFFGLDDIPNAIDYMYSRKNKGKVVVQLFNNPKL